MLLNLPVAADGMKSLEFYWLGPYVEFFPQTMERLSMICQTVTNLTIDNYIHFSRHSTAVTEESGFGLTELVKLVVERSENLQTLFLAAVSPNDEHVSSMIETIYLSKHTQLKEFGLSNMAR